MTFSLKAKALGLLAASLCAWGLTTVFDLAPSSLVYLLDRSSNAYLVDQLRTWATLYAVVGLPLALAFVSAVGLPLWVTLEGKGWSGRRDAAKCGGMIGLALALLLTVLSLLAGWRIWADPGTSSNSWSFGFQVVKDGLPTLIGGLFQLADIAATAVTGAVAGLTAWSIAMAVDQRRHASAEPS